MPKYYCDYCDAYLTHDSPSVRKTHNGEECQQKMLEAQAKNFQKRVPGAVVQTAPFPMQPMQPMRFYCLLFYKIYFEIISSKLTEKYFLIAFF
uniref:Matrin-type domain-containing protein n=1 Tax=Strongyloides stercoralis TaxID=6248 RepID=A0A0K0EER8_STRER